MDESQGLVIVDTHCSMDNLLKKRVDIRCDCKKKKSREKDRVKYGTCSCDSFSLCWTLGLVIHNYLIQYAHDASRIIYMKEDYKDEIVENAEIIKRYAEADNWDLLSKEKEVVKEYKKKRKEFEKAMKWLIDNWEGLWW